MTTPDRTYEWYFSRERERLAHRVGSGASTDPDVAALVSAVAIATAGVHERLDRQWPLTLRELLHAYSPDHARVLPAQALGGVLVDAGLTRPFDVPAGVRALAADPRGGQPVEFRTAEPTRIVPAVVDSVSYDPGTSTGCPLVRLRIAVVNAGSGVDLAGAIDGTIRLWLAGDGDEDVRHALYTALARNSRRVVVRPATGTTGLAPDPHVEMSGVEAFATASDATSPRYDRLGDRDVDPATAPDDPAAATGADQLRRLATFPESLLYVDLRLPGRWPAVAAAYVEIELARPVELLEGLSVRHVRLNCLPLTNRFVRVIDIPPSDVRTEHPLSFGQSDTRVIGVWSARAMTRDRSIRLPPALPGTACGSETIDDPDEPARNVRWHIVWRAEPADRPAVPHLVLLGKGYAALPGGVSVRVECTNWTGAAHLPARTVVNIPDVNGRPIRAELVIAPSPPLAPHTSPPDSAAAAWALAPLSGGSRRFETTPLPWLRRALELEARLDWDAPPNDGRLARRRHWAQQVIGAVRDVRLGAARPDNVSGGVDVGPGLNVAIDLNPDVLPGRSPMLVARVLGAYVIRNAPWDRWVRVSINTPEGECLRCEPQFHNRGV